MTDSKEGEAITYTANDLKAFRKILLMTESHDQLTRIHGRLKMKRFIEKNGKEKCDEMFAILDEE